MTSQTITESIVEESTLSWFEELGYEIINGPTIAPGELYAERFDYNEVILKNRLLTALGRINPDIPATAYDEAIRKLTHPASPSLVENNHDFHKALGDGVDVAFQNSEGCTIHDKVWLVDFENPENNEWLVVHQFTVIENKHNRRPDVVVFLNGIPLGVIELKNATDEKADVWAAFNQIQTYKNQIPSLFHSNEVAVVSDGTYALIGSLTADKERFMPWRTIEGEDLAPKTMLELEVMVRGVFEKRRFLDLIRHFIVFDDDNGKLVKKFAGYHQFHAVRNAVESTVAASRPDGDRRVGVVWHTQGSGKSLTMAFYAGKIIVQPEMENPTLVIITDRNDLDDQLFGTFAGCHELLRQNPIQAQDRNHLKDLLQVASGGVIFTTIQKFLPEIKGGEYPKLSDRRNIVVIADEAHRSQYDFIDGFARHMRDALPNASFIGFTGTPIELTDKNTRAVFGDYISVYDIQRAVHDKATVPIYYESRLAKLELDPDEKPNLDEEFEEVTEGEEDYKKEKLKTKWAALESLVGSEKRLKLIAEDLVDHFEKRLEGLAGKGMIVCMSRRICVDLYNAITALRPNWHNEDDAKGAIKVVMTGSASDPQQWQQHIRTKAGREAMAKRFKDPSDPLKLVIVRDMWLTGFDAPCLHTMYVDKPMRGHGLMQAIARVNRVFKDKPGGLIVDYLGLAYQLKEALRNYTESGGTGETAIDQAEAVAVLLEKYEVCSAMFHGFDWTRWKTGTPTEKLSLLPAAQEHILTQDDGKTRLRKVVSDLSKAFALSVPNDAALVLRDDISFFQAVNAALSKGSPSESRSAAEMDHAIQQLVSRAISSEEVLDVFTAAGLEKPDISILSDEFLEDVRHLPQRNLAVELLQKLLKDEIKVRSRKFLVQSRSFADMLEKSVRGYVNRSIETAKVIEELIQLARDLRDAERRGENIGLSDDEVAFYDALEVNDSAVQVLGDDTLKTIARELVDTVRKNTTIDWTVKESVRAKLRTMVRRILRKYGYPPDMQEKATLTVLEQAELLSAGWV